MNKVPQELIDRISSYLQYEDLKRTLFVSRKFQLAAEEQSGAFAKPTITANPESAARFLNLYSGRRFQYLRCIKFRTSFPSLHWDEKTMNVFDDMPSCRYSLDDLKRMDQHFTNQIYLLFSTLAALEGCATSTQGHAVKSIQLTIYTPTRVVDQNCYCWHHTYISWRVHLLSPATLPEIMSVRSLKIKNGANLNPLNGYRQHPSVRKMDLRILLGLTQKFPNLERLKCRVGGDEWPSDLCDNPGRHFTHDWEGPRRDSRRDFARTMDSITLPSLRYVDLDFMNPLGFSMYLDQRQAMPNLVMPSQHDPFSASLRALSYPLRRMTLRVMADETLFWPSGKTSAPPVWPRLESLSVMFHTATPSGKWYFRGLFNEGAVGGFEVTDDHYPPLTQTTEDEEMDDRYDYIKWDETELAQYRLLPNETPLVPLLTAFAKAAAYGMPSLRNAALWSPLKLSAKDVSAFYEDYDGSDLAKYPDRDLAWGIAYARPGEEALTMYEKNNHCQVRQIWWMVGNRWEPDFELHDLFRRIGLHEHGEGLKEHWDDDQYGRGLVEQYVFEAFEERMGANTSEA
ncbi:hypothetical protein BU26DRAFT_518202 [Trematosphaeria pertusa]|uniref:F-box domain-containing protein n=1 Tax=Trematosphaeria pertusa TaxID=390896 RepID=A0A6A6IMW3_9PLEO|nr:uncharacterized protein BU26DRAFT_518202 [Trematosphaeria pertusa]KAF2251579.1 hypothetical protein BU26DRAFT_518202 [Trematosphaeria pertusa]